LIEIEEQARRLIIKVPSLCSTFGYNFDTQLSLKEVLEACNIEIGCTCFLPPPSQGKNTSKNLLEDHHFNRYV